MKHSTAMVIEKNETKWLICLSAVLYGRREVNYARNTSLSA